MHSTNYDPFSQVLDAIEERVVPTRTTKCAPRDWRHRVKAMFPRYFTRPFSAPHVDLWEWVNAIDRESAPRPFCAFWSRGRGKSTVAEAAAADLGARGVRQYCMYVSGTQDQADKHVQTIARMLESDDVGQYFPEVGEPRVGKNGSRTWNRRVVTTASGYTVEAIGLNKAVRGQKIDWARPDLIIFDDVDEKHDTELTTSKKIDIITDSILPAGSTNCAVLFVQNLIHNESVATFLSRQPGQPDAAGFLMDRIISGPHVAVDGLQYETQVIGDAVRWVITAGEPVWDGFELSVCEDELNRVGPTAYLLEYQHEVDTDNPNALLSEDDFNRTRLTAAPDLVRIGIGVDPPGGATECGIVAVGSARIKNDWHGYTLEDATMPAGVKPEAWALAVLQCYFRVGADVIFVERNYGGDMVSSVIRQTQWKDENGKIIIDGSRVNIIEVVASRGKQVRAEPVATVYLQGRGHQVGHFPRLEKEWRQWVPGDDSPNRLDAHVWAYTGLGLTPGGGPLPKNDALEQESKWAVGKSNGTQSSATNWRKF